MLLRSSSCVTKRRFSSQVQIVLAGCWFAITSSGVPAAQVVRGPYLQIKTPTNIVVRWRTDVPTDSRVQFGTEAGYLDRALDMRGNRTDQGLTAGGFSPY